ncbi:hypothetical protein GW17_00049393 [Ensete ventricosum]|nr:hypothetical protein GW17_00049393 [Ensete ventricosum]
MSAPEPYQLPKILGDDADILSRSNRRRYHKMTLTSRAILAARDPGRWCRHLEPCQPLEITKVSIAPHTLYGQADRGSDHL